LAIYKEKGFNERRQTADEARKALLEKFKTKPVDDPAFQARMAERKAIAEAREQREAEKKRLKQAKAEAEARERAERQAAEEAATLAEVEAKAQAETDLVARLLADEADRKAKRDAKYAARKARVGKR